MKTPAAEQMSETLKSQKDLLEPDSRSAAWSIINRRTGSARSIGLDDYYSAAASIELNETVPEYIQTHFLTARHLAIYSWFVYRFTMVAQLQAYATLEYALRERLGYSGTAKPPALRSLLERAVSQGMLRDEAFRDWPGHRSDADDEREAAPPNAWVRELPEIISHFRNDIAHGSSSLYPFHLPALRVVADAINQLYPTTPSAKAPSK